MLWIKLLVKNVRPIVIVTVYRPPQGSYMKCCELLEEAFNKANLKDNTDVFVLGDFNINFNDKSTPGFRELNFTSQLLGLKQLISGPTRCSFRDGITSNSTIDLIFTNSDFIADWGTMDLNLSDHLAVRATRKKVFVKHNKIEFKGRSYRNYDVNIMQRRLMDENWEEFYETVNPSTQWEILQRKILGVIDDMCPIRSYRVNEVREEWITNEALEAIRDKDRALRKAKRTGRMGDWEIAKRLRNRVGRDIENLRADYLKNQQEANKGEPKNFWKVVQSVIPNHKSPSSRIWLKSSDTGIEVPPTQSANYINEFFTGIGPKLAEKHDAEWEYFGDTVPESVGPISTNLEEVHKLCKEINPMKSSGINELSSRICRDAFLALGEQLVFMFNSSLHGATFPEPWKKAKVVPLFKGGNREDVGNYRPVSLLPLPGKLLEKIVHDRISDFWNMRNFLSKEQGGFRKGFSTLSTIANLTDDLFNQVNDGKTTAAVFVDLRKAFDRVNLDILVKKLKRAGVRDNVLRWCKSYLSNRSQCTVANGVTSEQLPIHCGVPQGSVLGPLFFLVYVNDVLNAMDDCNIKLYADDTVLYQSGINSHETAAKLQTSLDLFVRWCSINKLTINIKKTKTMVFGTRHKVKKAKNLDIVINKEHLKLVPSYKYLGLIVDSTLNFNLHIASVIRIILHKMSLLAKMKKYLNNDVAVSIYKSMLLPYLDYADAIYSMSNAKDLGKLQKLQNKCLRICLGRDRRFSTDGAHKLSKVPFIKDRRVAHTLNFMYKRKKNKDLLNVAEIRTRAHDAPLFKVIVPRCESFKRSIGYHGATLWNNQVPGVRNAASYLEFKKIQKDKMLHPLSLIRLD